MKHIVKHLFRTLVLLVSLVLLLVGPLYYITIGESTLGSILTGAVKADYLINLIGTGLFTSIASFLAGSLFICWLFYLIGSIKNHKRGPKKVKAKKMKVDKNKQVEEINSVVNPVPTPQQAEVKPKSRHRIKF